MLEKVKSALLSMQRYSWEQGVCAQAFLEAGDDDIVVQMCYDAINRQTECGRPANVGWQNGVTDPIVIIPALMHAARLTGDPFLEKGLAKAWEWIFHKAPRSKDGIVYHMDNSRQFWVDSMYMLPPALICGGYADEAVKQANGYIDALWDSEKELFLHIWDDEKQTYTAPNYWGVGNGWALAGLARVIEKLPSDSTDRQRFISIVHRTINAALKFKDNNLFHDFLDRPETFMEVNFAQMLCYTICKGVKGKWLPGELMDDAKEIRAVVHHRVSPYGIVMDVCGAPMFNAPGFAPEGQAFFVLMETAWDAANV